jgi:hypothetical protein
MATENDPTPPAPAVPPAAITPEALHAAIEKARNEERTKLRGELETAQNAVKAEQEKVVTLTKANQQLTADLQALKASVTDGKVDVEKLVAEITSATKREVEGKLAGLEEQVRTERVAREKMSLEQLRMRLIAQAGGEAALIPSMVQGNSEQELVEAVNRSKAEFDRIRGIVGGTQTPPSQQPIHAPGSSGTPPALPAVPAGGGATAGGQPQVVTNPRQMSREDYAKNRQALKQAAIARYPTNIVTQR